MGMTWATPGTARSRRRSTQSAVVLSSSVLCPSEPSAMNMISPMMELTGARMGGGTSGGRVPRTNWSFSLTIWRA